MKIETEIREDHQARLSVEVEASRLEGMKQRAAAKIAKKIKIPGFRPGKAPYAVIQRQVGEETITQEAIELLVDELYPEVIKEAEIEPYGPGQLDGIPSMDPLKLEFVVPLEPTVELGDYAAIRKPYEPKEVTEKEIENVIDDLRERQAVIEPVERPAQAGDQVTVKLSAVRKAKEEDAEDQPLIRERSMPIIVEDPAGDNTDEWPFPGFSANLIGASPDDEKTVSYIWPEDAESENLRGVTGEFHYVVESIKSRTLPELNDEFVTSLGDFESLDDLRSNVRSMLEEQAASAYHQEYDNQILDEVVEQATYHYPPQMLENEINTVIHDLEHRLEHQGMDMDLYLKSRSIDMAGLREEVKPVAESRIKRTLFLMELGKAEGVQIMPDELQQEAMNTLNQLYQSLPEKEAKKLSDRSVYQNIVGNVLADMLSRRSLERLRYIASDGQAGWISPAAESEAVALDEEGEETPVLDLTGESSEASAPADEPAESEASQ